MGIWWVNLNTLFDLYLYHLSIIWTFPVWNWQSMAYIWHVKILYIFILHFVFSIKMFYSDLLNLYSYKFSHLFANKINENRWRTDIAILHINDNWECFSLIAIKIGRQCDNRLPKSCEWHYILMNFKIKDHLGTLQKITYILHE